MNSGNQPDINPANNGSLAGTLKFAFAKMMQDVDGMLPAQVIAFDRATNRAQVQLLIAVVTTSGAQISRPQLASLPVLQLGGGGIFLSFPLNPGDMGWVIANDRDISLFLQNYSAAAPNTGRIKSFSDGVFIPSVMTGYTIAEEDSGNAVIQNLDGTLRISIFSDGSKIKITAPIVEISGDLLVDGALEANAVTLSGGGTPNFTGNLFVDGNIQATGSITPDVPP